MASKPRENADRSERQKKSNAMTPRERRAWATRLLDSNEAIEKAKADQDRTIAAAWEAGMSYAAIGGLLGLHSTTVGDRVNAHPRGTEEDS